jgi:hypothetical protein
MTDDDWKKQFYIWHKSFDFNVRPPVEIDLIKNSIISDLPSDFLSFYRVTNGLRSEWFNMLPLHSPSDLKNTWNSLNRANNPSTTRFFGADDELMKRFFIFAEIGGGYCASIDRNDGSIWYEDEEGIHQTDLNLKEFIETTLREVAEL